MSDQPRTIGRYEIVRELGRGMMGVVYLAHDPGLGRDIALKVIQFPGGATAEDRSSYEERFFAEGRSAARLSHPGILVVHDVGRDPVSGAPFMALQFVPGRTLDRALKEKGRFEASEAMRIVRRVAEALDHAHSQGVVHRDIKPANLMLLPSGEPMIMDFGIAKIEATKLTATGQFIGTPLYMSPEQAMAKPVDGRSDLFSLGSVFYEMLTGRPAFEGESVTRILFQLMSAEPEPPSLVVAGLPKGLDVVFQRCLAKDPAARYPRGSAFADDLTALLEGRRIGEEASSRVDPATATVAGPAPVISLPPPTAKAVTVPAPAIAIAPSAKPKAPASPGRRRVIAGVVVAAGLSLWGIQRVFFPPVARRITDSVGTETPAESETPDASEAAQLTIDFEHSLKSGVLQVFVDDVKVVDEPVDGRVTRRIAGIEMRKGRSAEVLEVSPGERTIRVQVQWDDNTKSERTRLVFRPGAKVRLKVKLGGLGGLRKDLSLDWS